MDEKLRILKMLEDGIINANEASELLDALKDPDTAPRTGIQTASFPVETEKPYAKRMLRILVDEKEEGNKVVVQLPVGAIKKLLNAAGRLPIPEDALEGFNTDELISTIADLLDEEITGEIIDVSSEFGNSTVKICIE